MRKFITIFIATIIFCCTPPAFADIRAFDGICPICTEQQLKSEVKVEESVACSPKACSEAFWDDAGIYREKTSCIENCSTTYNYKCSQGHTFETLEDKRGISKVP